MFNSSNDCFLPSPSSPSGLIFNRQNHHSRYHPYNRLSTTYYPNNELEPYSYENPNPNHNSTISNYDHSLISYDYNLPWTTPSSSSLDNQIGFDGQTTMTNNVSGTGRFEFLDRALFFSLLSSTGIFFIHSKVLLVASSDVSQLIKRNAVVHSL